MVRCRTILAALALAAALSTPRAATADRTVDAPRLAAPLRALLARFLPLAPERPAAVAIDDGLDDELDAEAIDRARASRRAERAERVAAPATAGAAAGARRASAPSSP